MESGNKIQTTKETIMNKVVDTKTLRMYKKKFNFFETPRHIAKQMARLIDGLGRDAKILEPSAGLGSLINSVKEVLRFDTQTIDFCEIQDEFVDIIDGCNFVGRDFSEYKPGPIYDAVIMNPPYRNKTAEKHVDHAYNCVKPGGWIVALVSASAAEYLREEYYGHIFTDETFKKGFKETTIDTVLLQINKPLY